MSLFDDLLGSASHGSTSGQTTQAEQQGTSQQTTGSSTTTGQTTTQGSQTTQSGQTQNTSQNTSAYTASFDPATLALITSLITGQVGGASGAGQINDVAQQFLKAAQTPAVSAADIAGKQSAAVTSFNQNEAVDIGKLQQAIGSKGNTYSTLVAQKGQQDLASTLAGITADANATNAQIKNQQLNDAVNALVQGGQLPIQNIVALLSVLKGANTVSGESSTGSNITNILEQLTSGQTVNTGSQTDTSQSQDTLSSLTSQGTSSQAGKQGSGLLGLIF